MSEHEVLVCRALLYHMLIMVTLSMHALLFNSQHIYNLKRITQALNVPNMLCNMRVRYKPATT